MQVETLISSYVIYVSYNSRDEFICCSSSTHSFTLHAAKLAPWNDATSIKQICDRDTNNYKNRFNPVESNHRGGPTGQKNSNKIMIVLF